MNPVDAARKIEQVQRAYRDLEAKVDGWRFTAPALIVLAVALVYALIRCA